MIDGHDNLQSLIVRAGISPEAEDKLISEMMDLWSNRILYINRPIPSKPERSQSVIRSKRPRSRISVMTS
jgi:hypothetical protein